MCCPALRELPAPVKDKTGWPWTGESERLPDKIPDGRPWPKISIVTPSYNQGQFIEETIRSVLLQGYPNLEYIIIDGGSTDDSVEIIKKYEPWLKYWVSEPDKGQSHAINKGWKMATGEIFAYLNSDDTYLPGAIIAAESFLTEHPDISMIYGNCNFVDEEGKVICTYNGKEFDVKEMLFANIIPQQTVFFRDYVLDKIGYLDESLHMTMDMDMWIRIGLKLKLKYIAVLLANMRRYASNKTTAQIGDFLPERLKVIKKVIARPDVPEDIKVLKRKAYSHNYIIEGTHYYRTGELKKARCYLTKSILVYPPRLFETDVIMTLVKSLMGKNLILLCKKIKKKGCFSISKSSPST